MSGLISPLPNGVIGMSNIRPDADHIHIDTGEKGRYRWPVCDRFGPGMPIITPLPTS